MAQKQRDKKRTKLDVRSEARFHAAPGAQNGELVSHTPAGPVPKANPSEAPVLPHEPFVERAADTSRSPPWGPISFLLAVALPTFGCLLYLIFVAAPQFVSESRFVLRGSLEKLAIDSIGQAAALSALNNSQEAHVVADYIRSPRIVADLVKEFDLKRLYAGAPLDIVWHLPADASADRLVRQWQRMTTAEVDATTGIITVRVHAFEPEEAQAVNRAVIKLSEALVAGFTRKLRVQRLEETVADSKAAQAEMTALLAALEGQRNREDTLDPLTTATALASLVSTLRDERATLVAAREASATRLHANALTLALTDERIRALDKQIELVLGTIENRRGATGRNDLLSATSLFDILQTRRELIARRVSRAESALAAARQDAIRQQVYVDVFMQPTLGETKDHPKPLQTTLFAFLGLFAIWAIAALYFQSVQERTR